MVKFTTLRHLDDEADEANREEYALSLVRGSETAPTEAVVKAYRFLMNTAETFQKEKRYSLHPLFFSDTNSVLSHPNLPVELMDETRLPLSSLQSAALRSLAKNPSLTHEKARELFDTLMNNAPVGFDSGFHLDALSILLQHPEFTYEDVLEAENLMRYLRHAGIINRYRYSTLPESDREELIQEGSDLLHEQLASNPTLTEAQIRTLAKKRNASRIHALTRNPRTPQDILYSLYRYGRERHLTDYATAVLSNPATPSSILRIVYRSAPSHRTFMGEILRLSIAYNPNAPEDIVHDMYDKTGDMLIPRYHQLSDDLWKRVIEALPEHSTLRLH